MVCAIFLTLQSHYKENQALIAMSSFDKWCSRRWTIKIEGVKAQSIVSFDPIFLPHVSFVIKTTISWVSILTIVDLVDLAKEKIVFSCVDNNNKYGPIWKK